MEVLITNTDCHNKVEMQCSNCIAPLQCSVQHKDLDVYLSFLLERSSSPSSQPEHSIEVSDERLTIKITGLQPNTEYRAAITANDHQDMIQTISVEFHTVRCYNKIELGQLLAKAVQFVNSKNLTSGRPNFYPCSYLYRTKTPDYFQTIASDYDNIMKPYIKDNNGDPLSPINGRINGLFFSANVSFDDNQPVPKSPYGNRRFVVQIKAFELNSPETRLYFGDFYCRNGGYSDTHHVTLVLTKAGTAADTFCQRHLVELSKIDNPFFKIKTSVYSSETEAQVTGSGAWVEILYTQNVDINDWENIRRLAYFTNVTWSGRVGAALKTVGCSTCSLNVSN